MQLPDEEVITRFNEFVEAWDQRDVAESQLRKFEAKTDQPTPLNLTFEGIESFMQFNRHRREYVERYEELRRNRDASVERAKEAVSIVQMLLPPVCMLIHHHAGSRYVIRNEKGRVTVSSRTWEG